MLRANVGLTRTILRGDSTNTYSLKLNGEIPFSPDDPEAVLERAQELFDLAHEAVSLQIEKDDERWSITHQDDAVHSKPQRSGSRRSNRSDDSDAEPVTEKQARFLQKLINRQKLNAANVNQLIEDVQGRAVKIDDLSKQEAGQVIDALTQQEER